MKIDLERYLIQRYPMRLIDSVIEVTDHLVKCKAVVKEENVFYDPAICGIRSWVGLEFMAQTAAVFASFKNSQQSLPQIGFLISIRKFLCAELYFKLNDILIITAENLYMEDGVGVFQCQIELEDIPVASARLSAVQTVNFRDK